MTKPDERMSPATRPIQFEIVDHTADWALRVYGADMANLLANAALGMASLLVEDVQDLPISFERQLEMDAYDAETLLVDWLTELAYWAEEEQLVFRKFVMHEVTDTHLKATVLGGRAIELVKHIKAVTYHLMEITTTESGLVVTVVFDV